MELIARAAARKLQRAAQGDAAFDTDVSIAALRSQGDALVQQLDGKVSAITIAYASVNATSVIIDVNGEPHDLEAGPADEVRANAQWAAERLGVPFND